MIGCEKSGLFQAFSQHILYRLKIPFHERRDNKIQITFLSRDTMYRKVLNERQLLSALNNQSLYNVKRVIKLFIFIVCANIILKKTNHFINLW